MKLYFYQITGISREDTPDFSSSTARETFFDNHLVSTYLDEFYYPPYYRNEIRMSKSLWDVTYKGSNYLAIESDRFYYYFISEIEYVNSELIILHIEMDTIQTYYSHIVLSNALIERSTVKRWKYDNVNAVYYKNDDILRENIGNDIFLKNSKSYYTGKNDVWYVFKVFAGSSPRVTKVTDKNGCKYDTPYNYLFVPLVRIDQLKLTTGGQTTTYTINKGNAYETFFEYTGTKFIGVYIGNPFTQGVTITLGVNNILEVNGDMYEVFTQTTSSETWFWQGITLKYTNEWTPPTSPLVNSYYLANYTTPVYTKLVNSPYTFSRNTSKISALSPTLFPNLFDDNYMRIEVGNRFVTTTYPLYQYKVFNNVAPSLYLTYCTSIDDFSLYINLNKSSALDVDEYSTAVVDSNQTYIEFVNNTYAEYVANNQGRWGAAALKGGINLLETIVSVATHSYSAVAGARSILRNGKSYTPVRKKLGAKAQRALTAIEKDATINAIGDLSDLLTSQLPFASQAIEDYNYMHAPNSVNGTATYGGNVGTGFKYIFSQWSIVENLKFCMNYFNRYGFKVSSYISGSITFLNLLSIYTYRYYFDYIKFTNVDVVLNEYNSREVANDIQQRLLDGIRLWHVSNTNVTMLSYAYDNVEKDYL